MQNELDQEILARGVQILGVNQVGYEAGDALICEGSDLPWLRETAELDVWAAWAVTYRDVVVLDADNRRIAAYNVTEHDLSNPDNYAELRQLLIDAAQ